MKKLILSLIFAIFFMGGVNAQYFSGGNGSVSDPFQIINAEDLDNVRYYLNSYFKVMNDIDLSTYIFNNYYYDGWLPIGNESQPFTGGFDGGYYKIEGLWINRPDEDNIGLFGVLDFAEIEKVTIMGDYDYPIVGGNNTGMLAGKAVGDRIYRCFALVRPGQYIYGMENVGGLIGDADINIIESSSRIVIMGENNVGGLVGMFYAPHRITLSYSQGIVYGNFDATPYPNAGGLIGLVEGGGFYIHVSYAACVMINHRFTHHNVGGVVGLHMYAIKNQFACYDYEINENPYSEWELKPVAYAILLTWKVPTSTLKSSTILPDYGYYFRDIYPSYSSFCTSNPPIGDDDYGWGIVNNVSYPFHYFEKRYCNEIEDFQYHFDNDLLETPLLPFIPSYYQSAPVSTSLNENNISIYPNPSFDVVTVETTEENTVIEVYDANNNLLKKTTQKNIDMSSYRKGIYIFKINGEIRKVIKQ